MTAPLSVLDLSPIPAGSSVADAFRNTVDLARATERVRLPAVLAGRAPPRPRRGRGGADAAHRAGGSLVTTITHDHGDRVESYRLLADGWTARAAAA